LFSTALRSAREFVPDRGATFGLALRDIVSRGECYDIVLYRSPDNVARGSVLAADELFSKTPAFDFDQSAEEGGAESGF
jgi:hypothetical protein